eukprot:CAMPEP_0181304098 /NCGR_PEP_ID=MMETSP1101-20121128/8947_1 /TAXON_ID=46948 /ORGANISM="Rhodomonas abbreviata, Strain Caron Lab Isolate" /LENGTH=204 /DNA_ID=CAMNT_0023409789 /DNA_START=31 /DNA_END=641 /DNA_ORIENTATION=+
MTAILQTNTQDMQEFSCGDPEIFKRKSSQTSGKMVSLSFDDLPRADSGSARSDAGLGIGRLMSLGFNVAIPPPSIPNRARHTIPNRARHNRHIGLLLHKESMNFIAEADSAMRRPSTNEPEESVARVPSSECSSSFTSNKGSVSRSTARSLHNRSIGLLLMEEEMGAEGFDFSRPASRPSSHFFVEDQEEEEFSLSDYGSDSGT